jgi:cytochrome c oxidase subunit 2
MIGQVVVLAPAQYERWLQEAGGRTPLAASGEELFQQLRCHTCHRADGLRQGPALAGLFGTAVTLQTGHQVLADEGYLRESILNPAAKVVAGYQALMPTYQGQISEEGLVQMIDYLKSLTRPNEASG